MCVGVVFLKQWKQGNTFLLNLRKTSRDRGLFFMQTNYFFDNVRHCYLLKVLAVMVLEFAYLREYQLWQVSKSYQGTSLN